MLFYESIESHPSDWSALIFKDQTITFGDLRKTIDTWAAYLQAKGVQKGDRVGLFSKNCPEFVTAYHAIVKAGAIVVPINFMLSPTETSFILKDAGIKLLMTQEALDLEAALEKREYSGVAQLTFAEMAEAPEAVPATVKMHEDECCTIIYTSGTTGNPKGAMLSHKNILANIHSFTNAISMEPKDKAFCVLPMHHCFGWTVCVAGPMLKGGAIVIQDNYNVAEILRLIVTHKVDQFCGIPTFAQMFLRAAEPEHLASLRWFVSGGAPLPAHLSKAFKEKFGKYPQEGYGLSEAAPVCAVNPGDKIKVGSIGLALPYVKVEIHDENDTKLPNGTVGELCVQGYNVMLGYLNQPEASAETLRNHWLHTGDLAYMDDEGYIFIVDRSKDMIILGGENVYPREVEEVIYTLPEVLECAVVGVEDSLRGQAVCAFIVLKEGMEGDKKAIRKYLLDHLALYKVPRHYFFIEKMPKNGTGKIMKPNLREMAAALVHKV